VKRPKINQTRKEHLNEIIRCGSDPVYFIEKYVKISHPTKGSIPFELFPYQIDCLQAFLNNNHVITNKSRQLGLSTLAAAYSLWMAIFQREKNVLVIATKLSTAQLFVRKVKGMFKSLPSWLVVPNITSETNKSLEFDNGSKIHAIPTSPDAGRGEAVSLLIIDEAGWIADFEDLWIGLQPTLSCLTEDTFIFTDDGIKKIKDLMPANSIEGSIENLPKPISIYGRDGYEEATKYFISKPSPVLKFTTKRGYVIETTEKHPLWKLTPNAGKMEVASKLKIGDFLRVDYNQRSFTKDSKISDPNVAYALGGYIAEGNCIRVVSKDKTQRADGIQIRNNDIEFQDVFLNYELFGKKVFHKKKNEENRLLLFSRKATEILRDFGIDLSAHAHQKRTPEAIWGCSSEMQSHYLGGLFDGDGCVSNKEAILSSTSKRLIEETQILLLNKGIISRVQFVDPEKVLERERKTCRLLPQGKQIESVKPAWNLVIQRSQMKKFQQEVLLRIQRKRLSVENTISNLSQENDKLVSIPSSFVVDKIEDFRIRTGKSREWFRKKYSLRFDKIVTFPNKKRGALTMAWLEKFRNILGKMNFSFTEGDKRFFENLLGNFFFDEIVKIERLEDQKTYDFTLPKTHTFSQNGILGSNTGGDVILISSPSGVGTRFHKIWVGAQDKSNDFYPIELPWFVHPEHDEKWFEEQSRAIGSQRGINSELLCKFEGSGNGFVDEEQVSWLEKSIRPPLATYGPNQNVWIWRYQVPNHKYIIGADVARGDGEDFSSFYVIDMDESEVVCEFKGQLPADDFGRLLADIGGKYNNAVIIAEQQGGGIATNLELKRLKYPKVFYEKFSKEVLMGTKWLSDIDVEPYTPGLMMSVKSRNEGLVKLEQALRKKTLKIYSGRFVEELKTFIWHNNKAQAMKGYNDDLVMSLAITLLFFDPQGDQNFDSSAELARAMIAAMSVNQTTVKTFETQRSTSGWGAAHSTNPSNAGHFGGSSTDSRVMNSTRTPHWQNPWGWLDD